jgi:hypothetical protein
MNQRTKPITAAVLLAATLLVGIFGVMLFRAGTPAVQAQEPPATTLPRTITVVGEGRVSIEPDIARANIGVEVISPSVQEASADASATLEAVLQALRDEDVADEDIETSGFSIYAERFYGPEGPGGQEEVNYRVSNNVSVTIRNLDSVGAVLGAAINAGANNIYGVNFSLDDPSAAESEARARAVENASSKAEELAELYGASVGPVVSISEIIGAGGGFYSGAMAQDIGRGGGGAGPILPGQLDVTRQLEVVYSLQ